MSGRITGARGIRILSSSSMEEFGMAPPHGESRPLQVAEPYITNYCIATGTVLMNEG